MKFVHVEDFFHPSAGYQLNMLSKLQVRQGHEVTIITSELDKVPENLTTFFGKDHISNKDKLFEEKFNVKVIRFPIYGFYSGRGIFKYGLIKAIKKEKPDVVFIHGNDTLTGIRILLRLKSLNLPVIMDNHMLQMATVNRFSKIFRYLYRKFITPIIIKNKIPVIKIVDSNFVEDNYLIPSSLIVNSSFGTDADYFSPDDVARKRMREKYNICGNDFVVIYAGKINEEKGGTFLAKALKEELKLDERKIVFFVIGNVTNDDYGDEVKNLFDTSENKVIKIPTQSYLDLVDFYRMADIAIFPKQCSMSYFEVQACELPVVLENNEINIERVSNMKGILFNRGSSEQLRNAIQQFGNMSIEQFEVYKKNSRKNILENYNYSNVAQFFTDVMIKTYNNFYKR